MDRCNARAAPEGPLTADRVPPARVARAGRPAASLAIAALAAVLPVFAGCGKSGTAPGPVTPRHYRMGFAASAPRQNFPLLLQSLELMSARSDAAILSNEAPWDSLLAGVPPDDFVRRQQLPLAQYYR